MVDDVAHYGLLSAALVRRHHSARSPHRDVERVGSRWPDVRLPEPAEEDAKHRVGVGGGADCGAGVGAHPLLVDDDRRRQAVQYVDLWSRQRRHEALHKGAVGLVDQPLRLRGDRVEHQRALARAGHAGEHRQPALRDLDADVLEVVLARAKHADQVVAVANVQCRRVRVRHRGHAHRVSIYDAGTPVPADDPAWSRVASSVLNSRLSSPALRSLPRRRRSTPSMRRRSATWCLRRGSPPR